MPVDHRAKPAESRFKRVGDAGAKHHPASAPSELFGKEESEPLRTSRNQRRLSQRHLLLLVSHGASSMREISIRGFADMGRICEHREDGAELIGVSPLPSPIHLTDSPRE